MSGTTSNGAIKPVVFGPYEGDAGVAEWLGETQAAFFSDFRSVRHVTGGTVDGGPVRVIRAARSATVRGMVVVTFAAEPAA